MNEELGNIRIWVRPAQGSADFRLIINVINDKGDPIATIGSCNHNEPDKLQQILHAYRMGQRHAK